MDRPRKCLCYQKVAGQPQTPFVAYIVRETGNRARIRHKDTTGKMIYSIVNKHCCSSITTSPRQG